MYEQIEPGFMVFPADGEEGIGSVREVRPDLPGLLICIENAGDFPVPTSVITAVHSGKGILDCARLEPRVREAPADARNPEDPSYTAPAADANE